MNHRIGEPGPRDHGVVQFENWSWPGVAIQGDRALPWAASCRAAAELIAAENPDVACRLIDLSDALEACRVSNPNRGG